ncbi:hypothetical protein ACIP4Y_37455 [Streptomyces sp. NPDC088810]|uniref:hypothetical protein n=1 Tax=Streptomyces sp. NPDC088810 TaxID=3365904 RepID=UPI0037F825B9
MADIDAVPGGENLLLQGAERDLPGGEQGGGAGLGVMESDVQGQRRTAGRRQ